MKSNLVFCGAVAGLILLASEPAQAAIHYIRAAASGSNDGSSWANAYTDIPDPLVRGDTYYLAGGSYPAHSFSSVSGTSQTYLKKANLTDNSGDAGWSSSYTNQAIFNSGGNVFSINMSYLTIDGVTGSGTNDNYGIKLVTTGRSDASGCCINSRSVNANYQTNRYIELSAQEPDGTDANFVYNTRIWPGASYASVEHCYIHGGLVALCFTGDHQMLDHTYMRRCGHKGHSEMVALTNCKEATVRYCVFENIIDQSTTYIEPQRNGTGLIPTGLYIYGNVFWHTASDEETDNPAVFSSTALELVVNVFFYNNTCYGLQGSRLRGGDGNPGISGSTSGSGPFFVQNNIWQACYANPTFANGIFMVDHNDLNTGAAGFVNAAGGDFHLANNTSAGVALGAPFNIDADGNVRTTWSLGAFEYAPLTTNPVVSISPALLSFGSIQTNTTRDLSFTVQNVGLGTLAGPATIAAPFSVVSGAIYSLGANQSQTVTIRYSPTVAGSNSQIVIFTGGGGATATVSGVATLTNANLPPTVSQISQNAADVDPIMPGLQIFEGSTVQYSGSASDPNGDPLTWQWIYTVNGGPEVVLQSGAGAIAPASFSYGAGTAGSTYTWKLRVSDGQATSESQLTVGVDAIPVVVGSLSIEAESGILSAPFVSTNGYISQSSTTDLASGGRAVYGFDITNAGNYVIQALVNAPSLTENSFWLNIDVEPQDPVMAWDILPVTVGFENRLVSWRGNGTADANELVPKIFSLTQGTHQLIIRGREANTQLDRFAIIQMPSTPSNLRVFTPLTQ